LLLNNVAFCLLSLNQVDDGAKYLAKISLARLKPSQRSTYLATSGLLAYRRGRTEEGRQLYGEAINETRDPVNRALAAIMMAREEVLASQPQAWEAVARAHDLREKAAAAELDIWLNQLKRNRRGIRVTLPTRRRR
jgi:hypothetical protein